MSSRRGTSHADWVRSLPEPYRSLRSALASLRGEFIGIVEKYDKCDVAAAKRARVSVAQHVEALFFGRFAELADQIIEVVGRDNFPANVPDPPSGPFPFEPLRRLERVFGAKYPVEAGKLALLWAAAARWERRYRVRRHFQFFVTRWLVHQVWGFSEVRGNGAECRPDSNLMEEALQAFDAIVADVIENRTNQTAASTADNGPNNSTAVKRRKRSTQRGDGRAKLIAALTKYHEYADDSCLNDEPVGNNKLARLACVSGSTASAFFEEFGGYAAYRQVCADKGKLVASLKLLNQEYSPRILFGRRPPGEGAPDD